MNLLAEGVESLKLACSIVLLLPLVGVALLGRRRLPLIGVWIATSVLVAWLRFTTWWPWAVESWPHIVGGVALIGLVIAAWKYDNGVIDTAAVAAASMMTTWTWVPCVGRHLGEILNSARKAPWSQLPPTALYLVGLFIPLILFGAATVAAPSFGAKLDDRPALRTVGLAVLAMVGLLVMTTTFDDVAGELARRSSF